MAVPMDDHTITNPTFVILKALVSNELFNYKASPVIASIPQDPRTQIVLSDDLLTCYDVNC